MNERDRTRLRDMLDAARKALEFSAGKTRENMHSDDLLAFALARAVEKNVGVVAMNDISTGINYKMG